VYTETVWTIQWNEETRRGTKEGWKNYRLVRGLRFYVQIDIGSLIDKRLENHEHRMWSLGLAEKKAELDLSCHTDDGSRKARLLPTRQPAVLCAQRGAQ
jgi:hypothetical protein